MFKNLQSFENIAVFEIIEGLVLDGFQLVVGNVHRLQAGHVWELGEEDELIGRDVQGL